MTPRLFLTGPQLVGLMRQYCVTIAQLATRLQTTQARVRDCRVSGLLRYSARDWLQAITGHDPGALAQPWRGQETLSSARLHAYARLFLRYEVGTARPYVVETSFEQLGRYATLEEAEATFEALACGPGGAQQRAGT
jgi:hypothetical protein